MTLGLQHDRIGIEKRIESGGEVKTSDLARLMELFQSALLKYWEFESLSDSQRKKREEAAKEAAEGRVEGKKDVPKRNAPTNSTPAIGSSVEPTEEKMREGWGAPAVDLKSARTVAFDPVESAGDQESSEEDTEPTPPPKRVRTLSLTLTVSMLTVEDIADTGVLLGRSPQAACADRESDRDEVFTGRDACIDKARSAMPLSPRN